MKYKIAGLAVAGLMSSVAFAASALAADKTIVIGNVNDMSSLYADTGGIGSEVAAKMAIEDSGMEKKGWKISVISVDHQNKPDVGATLTRQLIDEKHADVIIDTPNSGVALAVAAVVKEKNKVFIPSGAASAALTGAACTPNTVHWTYDTYELAHGTGGAITRAGGKSWFFLTADYAFGKALEADTTAVVKAEGGKVLGHDLHPLNTADFSSFLLQAQASKAQVIGLANAGGDTINSIKQAAEFGIIKGGQTIAPLLLFITDVNAMGLKVAQGLEFTSSFYWDMNDGTRAWSKRFQALDPAHHMPTQGQAGAYAGVLHYLKAVDKLGDASDGAKVVAEMKALPTDDPLFGKGTVRIDGRVTHPAYLFKVKTPAESKYPWDYYKLVATIPADKAFRPLSESDCPLVKK